MNLEFVKRAKKLTTLVVVSSILVLTLVSLLPWVSVIETTSTGDTLTVYNVAKMEKSTDRQIGRVQESLELITTCFWIAIIFGMISLAGTIVYLTGEKGFIAQLMMIIGCVTIIFSILGTILLWMLIGDIDSMSGIFAAFIFQNNFITLKYAYFPLMAGIISTIGSILYIIIITLFSIKRAFRSVEQRKSTKKKAVSKPPAEEKQKLPEQKKTLLPEISHEYESDEEPGSPVESEEPRPQKKYFEFDKEETKRTDPEEKIPKTGTPKEVPKSPLFEKALDSAIEKRYPDVEKEHVEVKKEEPPAKKKINIRCPQCKTVFIIEKGEKPTNIECPKCGKTGKIN